MAAAGRGARAPERMTVEEFCDTYYDRVVGLAVHAFGGDEAYDVAHEALSRVLASYSTLDPERDAWPWLATIVRNAGRERLRRRRWLALEEAHAVAAPDVAFDAVAAEEELRTLALALERMPSADRDVLLMRVRDELPFAEIARRTGRTPGALRVQAARARQRLAEEFARLGGTAHGVVLPMLARLRARVTGNASAWPAAAQLATAAIVCGLAGGTSTAPADVSPPVRPAPRVVAAGAAREVARPPATTTVPPATPGASPARATSRDEPAQGTDATRRRPLDERGATVRTPGRDVVVRNTSRASGPSVTCALLARCYPPGTQLQMSTPTPGWTPT